MNKLVEQLKDCQELVDKCAHLPLLKYHRIKFYAKKLKGCNDILNSFVTRSMTADVWEVTMTNRRVQYECSVPEPPEFTVGWREPVGELKQLLLQEELPVIGICGPDGCGKSTLVKKLCQQVKGDFERISYIGIPRKPDCPDEKEETEKLDWTAVFNKLWEDLVAYRKKPKSTCKEDALQQLEESLNKRKKHGEGLLVVLDGVWSARMLRNLVIKTPGLRTLVTSRKRLHGLDCRYDVPQLTMRDAKDLFIHHALSGEGTSEHLDELLVEQLVKLCKFKPLALEFIGSSLKNVMSRNSWITTARTLLEEGGISKQREDAYWPLKTSLDSLKEAVLLKCLQLLLWTCGSILVAKMKVVPTTF